METIAEASKAICNHTGEGADDSASKTPKSTMHTADLTQGDKARLRRRLSLFTRMEIAFGGHSERAATGVV